jgi:hypothetical protein
LIPFFFLFMPWFSEVQMQCNPCNPSMRQLPFSLRLAPSYLSSAADAAAQVKEAAIRTLLSL